MTIVSVEALWLKSFDGTHHSLTLRVVSPGLVVSNDTIQLLGVLALGPWLLAVGLVTASGAIIFHFAKAPLTVVRRQATKTGGLVDSLCHSIKPPSTVAMPLADCSRVTYQSPRISRQHSLSIANVERTLLARDPGVHATFCFSIAVGPADIIRRNARCAAVPRLRVSVCIG